MKKQICLSGLSDELAQVKPAKKFSGTDGRHDAMKRVDRAHQAVLLKGERGNNPYETMLRIHLLQNLYNLSDMGVITEVLDSRAFSDFCDVDFSNQVPDGDTIGRFRALLVMHDLQEQLFTQVVELLMERGLMLKKGTIVYSTIIATPSPQRRTERRSETLTRTR